MNLDDRAAATTIGYVSTLGVTALLVSGLLLSVGGFANGQQETTIREELRVIGEQTAGSLAAVDRAAEAGSTSTAETRLAFPERVAGVRYRMSVTAGPPVSIELVTPSPEVTVTVTVATTLDASGEVDGGPIRIVYTGTDLEVRDG